MRDLKVDVIPRHVSQGRKRARDRRVLSEVDKALSCCLSAAEWDAEMRYEPQRVGGGVCPRIAGMHKAVFGNAAADGSLATTMESQGRGNVEGRRKGRFQHSVSDLGLSRSVDLMQKKGEKRSRLKKGVGGGEEPQKVTASAATGGAGAERDAHQQAGDGGSGESKWADNLPGHVGAAGFGRGMGLGKMGAALWMIMGGVCAFGAAYVMKKGA